jgi:fused signal recognition particle receptor
MKRYLWTAVAVLFVNANASENPFALKENLLKIDNDQEILLLELSKIAEARENAELEADDDNMDAELAKEANAKEAPARIKKAKGQLSVGIDVALDAEDAELDAELAEEAIKHGLPLAELEKEASAGNEDSEEQNKLTNAIDEIVGDDDKIEGLNLAGDDEKKLAQKAEESALKLAQEKEAEEKADREKQEQLEATRLAEEKALKEANARETERLEVAAYEKERAEKIARKAQEDAIKKSAELEAEQKLVAENMRKEARVTGDIDLVAEKEAAKEAADNAYLDAVREMDQED